MLPYNSNHVVNLTPSESIKLDLPIWTWTNHDITVLILYELCQWYLCPLSYLILIDLDCLPLKRHWPWSHKHKIISICIQTPFIVHIIHDLSIFPYNVPCLDQCCSPHAQHHQLHLASALERPLELKPAAMVIQMLSLSW